MDMCLLIPILVGLVCALLGYLLGKLLGSGNDSSNTKDVDVYKNRISKLEADLKACKENKESNYSGGNSPANIVSNVVSTRAKALSTFDDKAAKAAFGKKINQDDLTVIEGIGPKIKELFYKHDIKTWAALAACSVEKCQQILNSGGKRFEIHKPGTWPEQAKLADQGKWEELKDWQNKLDGGK